MSDCSISVLEKRVRSPTVRENVSLLCKKYPSIKGDYRLLLYRYWREVCGINISLKTFDEIRRAPSPMSITRRFQELNAEFQATYGSLGNPYAPSPETISKRRKNEFVHRDFYSKLKRSDNDTAGYTDGALV